MAIRLVKYEKKHLYPIVRLLNNPKVTHTLLSVPYPYTIKHAEEWIMRCEEMYKSDDITEMSYALEVDGELAGGIGLHNNNGHSAEIGYWIGEEYWDKGIMTEAVKQILLLCLNELGLVRVTARVFEGNKASEKVLKKNGFEKEGFMKKYCVKDGEFINMYLYAYVK